MLMISPRSFPFALVLALLALAASPFESSAGEVADFYNTLAAEGADPWVIRHDDGWYYLCQSMGRNVTLRRSRTITGLAAGERKVVWSPPRGLPYSEQHWAPELHFVRGKWYVYVAADDGENANHRMYVLENPSADPFQGEFILKGKIFDPESDKWAIDGTVLNLKDKLYFIWSGWEGDVNVDQRIYIAPMSDPWTIGGARVELSRPTHPWEKKGGPPTINEGPQTLVRGDRVFIVYSAAGSWTDHYCLGLLSAQADADLLDPASWRKSLEPVFAGANGVVAPGHGSFTTSPDGREDWFIYHAARFPGSGWARSIRAQPFHWTDDGQPIFGEPVSPNRPIPTPTGEPRRLRFENLGDQPRIEASVEQAGDYALSIRFRNSAPRRDAAATMKLIINGRDAGSIRLPRSGENWSCALARVPLNAGANQIELTVERDHVELDSVDLIP